MANPVYFPILRAKAGEIDAIGRLAPATQRVVRPMLDFPKQREKDSRPLGDYVAAKVQEISSSWGTGYEVYLDFSRYEPNAKLPDGRHITDHVFDIARKARLKAVPVVAPLAVRGPGLEYFEAISRIVARDKRGAGLRLPYETFSEESAFQRELKETLTLTGLSPPEVDVLLDAGSLALVPAQSRDEISLTRTLRDAVKVLREKGYRNVVFVASAMPDSMTHHERGTELRVPRTEFRVWRRVLADPAFSVLRFGDYGVVYPGQVESEGRVIPPSRVRTATEDEYVLYKGARDDIRAVSRAAVVGGIPAVPSWGANAVRECAAGYGDPGGAAQWVARDTNMHIESTVSALARHLPPRPPEPVETEGGPWLQEPLGLQEDS